MVEVVGTGCKVSWTCREAPAPPFWHAYRQPGLGSVSLWRLHIQGSAVLTKVRVCTLACT